MTPYQVKTLLLDQGFNPIVVVDYVETCVIGSGEGESYYQKFVAESLMKDFTSFVECYYGTSMDATTLPNYI